MEALTIFRAFMYYSGLVFWVSIVFCCLVLIFLRRARDIVSDEEIYENELKAVRTRENESGDVLFLTEEPKIINENDNEFTLTLEKYLGGEAKTTQYD